MTAMIIKPSTLIRFHRALVDRKYSRLFSNKGNKRPGPKGPSRDLINAVVELKRRNPRFGCPRIAYTVSLTFGVKIDKNVRVDHQLCASIYQHALCARSAVRERPTQSPVNRPRQIFWHHIRIHQVSIAEHMQRVTQRKVEPQSSVKYYRGKLTKYLSGKIMLTNNPNSGASFFFVFLMGLFIQGCAVQIPVETPSPSTYAYEFSEQPDVVSMRFVDELGKDHELATGSVSTNVTLEGESTDTFGFVFDALVAEFDARGMPVSQTEESAVGLELHHFNLIHHRVSSFSPWVTVATTKAVLNDGADNTVFATMIRRAKVPVWVMTEIIEPCYNQPVELMVKEIAARTNQQLFGGYLADETVDALARNVRDESDNNRETYLDVYELGFSNNPSALQHLAEFLEHSDEYIRMAAVSGIGMFRAEQYTAKLKEIYENNRLWADRGIALKALGDIGTEDSLAYLQSVRNKWGNDTGNEASWEKAIIELYVD